MVGFLNHSPRIGHNFKMYCYNYFNVWGASFAVLVLGRENIDANEHERLYTQKQIETCSVLYGLQ